MKPPAPRGTRILEALLVLTAAWLLAPERSCAQLPPVPPATPSPCNRFNLGTEWKGAFTLTGTGSGTFPDGGSYRINESITAAPDFLASPVGVPGIWAGNVNETIHIDDIETHPDQAAPGGVRFTHITDDETIPQGPLFASTGQPGGG